MKIYIIHPIFLIGFHIKYFSSTRKYNSVVISIIDLMAIMLIKYNITEFSEKINIVNLDF